jgi:archaellum component FlaC
MEYETKRKEPNYWHGLGTGCFIALVIGFVCFGIAGDRNKELGRISDQLREEQERVRVIKETAGSLEHNLVIERKANTDIRRDFGQFLDITKQTIDGLDKTQGNSIEKLRRIIESLKEIASRIRDMENNFNLSGSGGNR